jgi:outer membrane protein TolC
MYRLMILAGLILLAGCSNRPRDWEPADEWSSRAELGASPTAVLPLEGATVQTFVDLADRNPAVQAARDQWLAALHAVETATSLPDPMLMVTIMGEEVQTRNGPVDAMVTLNQKLPWFGKLSTKGRVQVAEAARAWAAWRSEQWRVRTEINNAASALYVLRVHRDIKKSSLELVERLLQTVKTRYTTGKVTQQDLLKIEIEQAGLKRDIDNIDDMEKAAAVRLNALTDRDPMAALPDFVLGDTPGESRDHQGLSAVAQLHNPGVQNARLGIAKAYYAKSLAELAYYPDPTLGAQYQMVGDTNLGGAPDPGEDAWGVSVGINLPIWTGPRDARVAAAEANLSSMVRMTANMENMVEVQLTGRLAEIATLTRKLNVLEEEILPRAEQAIKSSQSAYESGKVDILNLLDSEKKLLGFQMEQVHLHAELNNAHARLRETLGEEK